MVVRKFACFVVFSVRLVSGFHLLLGKPVFSFPVHMIGHELSSLYDMTHGVTLALLTPAWMEYTLKADPSIRLYSPDSRAMCSM